MWKVAILDFGSQTTQLIARRVRELKVYCEIFPCTASLSRLQAFSPAALILSGGPASVHVSGAPKLPEGLLDLNLPTLGICYGMQALVQELGGQVLRANQAEYGRAVITSAQASDLFADLPHSQDVWMSHGDQIDQLPQGFIATAQSETCPFAAIEHTERKLYGIQFHPEVTHTTLGTQILSNFVLRIAGLEPRFEMRSFLEQKIVQIQDQVGGGRVLMALSGGVDSAVAAALIHRAIGSRLTCVYVDHGLGRQGDAETVLETFGNTLQVDLRVVHAAEQFFAGLAGEIDPEKKRKIIGRTFIEVFDTEAKKLGDVQFLGQGTLYPDVIESVSAFGGPSAVIKSHHNVGGLPERLNLKLVEPLRELFKDEVRQLGLALGLPKALIEKQPFPGPGLAVRIMGDVTPEKCALLRAADQIVQEELASSTQKMWQWFAVLLGVKSVGVMGDGRTYGETICVRCVESEDGMTADFVELPKAVLARISNRMMNEVRGISRVVYDISSKPPSTIEWE